MGKENITTLRPHEVLLQYLSHEPHPSIAHETTTVLHRVRQNGTPQEDVLNNNS